jgi:hypothetical protein
MSITEGTQTNCWLSRGRVAGANFAPFGRLFVWSILWESRGKWSIILWVKRLCKYNKQQRTINLTHLQVEPSSLVCGEERQWWNKTAEQVLGERETSRIRRKIAWFLMSKTNLYLYIPQNQNARHPCHSYLLGTREKRRTVVRWVKRRGQANTNNQQSIKK